MTQRDPNSQAKAKEMLQKRHEGLYPLLPTPLSHFSAEILATGRRLPGSPAKVPELKGGKKDGKLLDLAEEEAAEADDTNLVRENKEIFLENLGVSCLPDDSEVRLQV